MHGDFRSGAAEAAGRILRQWQAGDVVRLESELDHAETVCRSRAPDSRQEELAELLEVLVADLRRDVLRGRLPAMRAERQLLEHLANLS